MLQENDYGDEEEAGIQIPKKPEQISKKKK